MINKKDLNIRELDGLTDFFEHIYNNYVNGNNGDVKKFIKKLSKPQKLEFHYYLQTVLCNETKKALSNILIETVLNPDF